MTNSTDFSQRELLFISHANPEDNEFAKWLTVRLAAEGYPVFCEIFDFLGGEDAWKSVQTVLRERTIKFLFVLSEVSNEKDGARNELNQSIQIAKKHGFEDFIIPLKIDEFPHHDVCIELQRIISIEFYNGWANGLSKLLEKLQKQSIPKSDKFTPEAVSSWWRNRFNADAGLREEPEELLSNWFEIDTMPSKFYHHQYQPFVKDIEDFDKSNQIFPYRKHSNGVISCANADDFPDYTQIFSNTRFYYLDSLLQDKHTKDFIDSRETRDILIDLFRQAWEKKLIACGLETYEMASGSLAGYFVKDQVPKDKLFFTGVDNKKTHRGVVGFKTTKKDSETGVSIKKRYWHYGISAKAFMRSTKYFAVNSHVLFSDDGSVIWIDKDKMHKAKMRQCADWWNDEWRDRMLAVMEFLANGEDEIQIILSSDFSVNIAKSPTIFTSPVSFDDPVKVAKNLVEESEEVEAKVEEGVDEELEDEDEY
jgi:TIR domain